MAAKLWEGRFSEAQSALFDDFNRSLAFDSFLVHADILGSGAHVAGLQAAGVLQPAEASRLLEALQEIDEALRLGTLKINPQTDGDEDVHMWLERQLTERTGNLGKRIHTGRSRNDQVATAMKLWLKERLGIQKQELISLMKTLLVLGETFAGNPMPGYTHLQPAQPITLGFHLLTYVAMLERDLKRLEALLASLDESPLGAGALAGTSYPIDRELTAQAMGFSRVALHAMDAVSDRDYVLDYLHMAAMCLMHLSRLAEELILWSTPRFGFVTLSDQWTSGSSMMPNKKNPDACELIRGKAAIASGRLSGMFGALKGLPLAYNKDLQEDKQIVLQGAGDLSKCLVAMREQLATATFHAETMAAALADGYVNATDAADWLVAQGVPFREAHQVSGALVKLAIAQGVAIEALPDAVLITALEPALQVASLQPTAKGQATGFKDFRLAIGINACLSRRSALGGTSPVQVMEMVKVFRTRLQGKG